jgi:hypothetical protein
MIMEEYKYIFSSPTKVPQHYQVKHSINIPVEIFNRFSLVSTLEGSLVENFGSPNVMVMEPIFD